MPSFSSRKLVARVPFVVLLGLAPLASLAVPSCSAREPVCGDARVDDSDDPALDEECDDGNTKDDDDCTNTCKLPLCGDGVLQAGNNEECDDGNDVDSDGCTQLCNLAACGDGVARDGVEECDDGNLSNTDDCLVNCLRATCGDNFIHLTTNVDGGEASLEECDDANDDSTDNCTVECKKPKCGDSHVWNGFELCDDGNTSNADACPSTCVPSSCGDGFVDAATEECDDKNQIATDACLPTCVAAQCGDGIVQEGVEECDAAGDPEASNFCDSTCKKKCSGENAGLFEGRCYLFYYGALAWPLANCNAFGTHLVTIESAAENTFVQGLLPADAADAWIGLTDQAVESAWFWQVDQAGARLQFPVLLKWAAAQPDNTPLPEADCAVIHRTTGLWHDQPCDEPRGFVCEYDF